MSILHLLVVWTLSQAADPPLIPAPKDGLHAIQTPALDKLEPSVARQLEQVQHELRETIQQGDDLNTGAAYATLAEYYHAYAMPVLAEKCYRNALDLDEIRYSAVYLFAHLLQEQTRLDEAEPLLQGFVAKHDNYAPAWYQLGELNLALGKLDEAEAHFHKGLALRPKVAALHAALGRVDLARSAYADAVAHFEEALALLPKATRLNYFLGTAWRKLGDKDKARDYIKKAGKIGPKMPDPLYARLKEKTSSERLLVGQGKSAFAAGDLKAAAALFTRALEANPDSLTAHINLGSTQSALGLTEEAIAQFRMALDLNDTNTTAHYNLGLLLAQRGEIGEAVRHLETVVGLNNKDLNARRTLGQLHMSRRAWPSALVHYEILAEAAPHDEDALVKRAQLLMQLGEFEKAAEVLAKDWQNNPNFLGLTHLYARFLATSPLKSLRNGTRAVGMAKAVVAAQVNATHLETLALAYAEQAGCDLAAEAQERAIHALKAEGVTGPRLARFQADLERYKKGAPCGVN